jgi:biotin synthase
MKGLTDARDIFGRATAHLIVGLGETDEEIIRVIQLLKDRRIDTALFALTPIKGMAKFIRPSIERYRAIQFCRYLIVNDIYNEIHFGDQKLESIATDVAIEDIDWNEAFVTSGCPNCNRPFYNERVRGPLYNYPRNLSDGEIRECRDQLGRYINTKLCRLG